jgi:hypothetical protein
MTAFHRGYADRAASEGGRPGDPIRFLASTPGVKRDGLDLRTGGWKLDNFRKSPVFQWVHDKTKPPIGRVDAEVRTVLESDVFFDQDDPFARQVESKYRRGFLHAVSVGWDFVDGQGIRLNTSRLSLDEIRDRAFYDMTELSGVPVPADPDALKTSQRDGLRSLSRELAVLFDEQEDPDGEALAEQVRAAVWDELERLGIEIPGYNKEPADQAGFLMPDDSGRAASRIDSQAARTFLAAFSLQGVS